MKWNTKKNIIIGYRTLNLINWRKNNKIKKKVNHKNNKIFFKFNEKVTKGKQL